jgi:hypothetical protein
VFWRIAYPYWVGFRYARRGWGLAGKLQYSQRFTPDCHQLLQSEIIFSRHQFPARTNFQQLLIPGIN